MEQEPGKLTEGELRDLRQVALVVFKGGKVPPMLKDIHRKYATILDAFMLSVNYESCDLHISPLDAHFGMGMQTEQILLYLKMLFTEEHNKRMEAQKRKTSPSRGRY